MSEFSSLNDPIPVFPLPGCVMLPGAVLPLHVFEPRYRAMVHDVVSRPQCDRFIATALLSGDYEHLYDTNNAPIAPAVCVGQVVQHAAMSDGRCNIVLVGRARAHIVSEDATHAYRQAVLRIIPTEPANLLANVDAGVDTVRMLMCRAHESGIIDPQVIDRIKAQSTSAATMVDLAAFHLIDNNCVALKQRILDESKLEVRAEILAKYLAHLLGGGSTDCGDSKTHWPPTVNPN